MQQALIHEERKHSGGTEVNESESVLFGKLRQGKREPPMCYKCKEVGHIQHFCPLNNRSRTKPSTSAHKAKAADQKCKKDESDSPEGELFPGAFTASERHASKAKQEMLWLIDSGASSHMTKNQDILSQFMAMKAPENVVLGDGRTVKSQGSGIVYMKMMFDKASARKAVLYNVPYVPDVKCNLFSIRAAVANDNIVKFGGDKCWLRDANGVLRGMGTLLDKMYQLNCESLRNNQRALVAVNNEADLWHQRLGHLHESALTRDTSMEALLQRLTAYRFVKDV